MLGAADMSFSGKENLWNLGGKIGTQLVQVLLEVFLVSHTKKDELWQLLKTQIVNCRERKPTIKHWSSIVIGTQQSALRFLWFSPTQRLSVSITLHVGANRLSADHHCFFSAAVSKRVLRLLYGPSEGADTVSLGGSLIVTNLELKDVRNTHTHTHAHTSNSVEYLLFKHPPQEFVLYILYRLVYLIGPAEGVEVPSFYLELMQGVSQLVNIYLAVGQAAEKYDRHLSVPFVGAFTPSLALLYVRLFVRLFAR